MLNSKTSEPKKDFIE